jgi:hypothetical protein
MKLSLRSARRSLFRILLAGLGLGLGGGLAGTLAGCSSGVGSGNGPSFVTVAAPSTTAALPSLRMYECLTSGLRALVTFQDGSVGDFTSRVVWASSNPGAVQVSNGDIAVPGGTGLYAKGVLIPTGAGNAVVTANYYGLIGQTAVSVGTPKNISLKAVINGNYVPLAKINPNNAATGSSFSMGQGTTQQLAATAVLDDVETDVTKFANFGFQTPNDAVAAFGGAGVLEAGVPGGPVVPQVSFPPCSLTNITDPNNIVTMTVSAVQSIAMQPEFPQPDPTQPVSDSNPLPQIIVGNSERFPVIATLRDGNSQDVSSQSVLTVSGTTNGAVFGGVSGINNLLFVTQAGGPLILKATFDVAGSALTAPTVVTSAVEEELQSFSVCATDLFTSISSCPTTTQPVPTAQAGSLTPVQFHAFGYYGLDANNQPITQDITRVITWSSNNTAIATIGNSGNAAGQAAGVQQGSTIITAQGSAINVPQVFTQVNVSPPP